MNFDWGELAFGSKKEVNQLKAIFILAPREFSIVRFKQLIKEYLPQGNIVLGLAKEKYVADFENEPQFKTLQVESVQNIINKVNGTSTKHKIYTLSYFQREGRFILEKLNFMRVLVVNGSYHFSFHMRPEYYILASRGIPYTHISPFVDQDEAKAYDRTFQQSISGTDKQGDTDMMNAAYAAARQSYDYTHQTGVALGKKAKNGYKLLATAFNRVVPYQTHAMHFGSEREKHFSPANDLNYYDTIHAETDMLLTAQKQKLDLHGTTLFINLLPCPTCARMLACSDIQEFVYTEDHSDGYAVKLLQEAGKEVRRVV